MFLTDVRTVCQEIWENNPYITKLIDVDIEFTDQDIMMDDILIAKAQYPLIHKSNTGPSHFTEGFTDYFEDLLGIRIKDRICKVTGISQSLQDFSHLMVGVSNAVQVLSPVLANDRVLR